MKINLCMAVACSSVFAAGCGKMNTKSEEIHIQTKDGPVVATSTPAPNVPQVVVRVSAEDAARFRQWALQAPDFLRVYIGEVSDPSLTDYDRAFKAWQNSSKPRHSRDEVIHIIGAFLGQKMADDLQMEWVKVSDQYGTDYAVRHIKSEVIAFPFSSVQKRIEDNQHDFIRGVYETTKHTLGGEVMQRKG